jgi:hypothetical protein
VQEQGIGIIHRHQPVAAKNIVGANAGPFQFAQWKHTARQDAVFVHHRKAFVLREGKHRSRLIKELGKICRVCLHHRWVIYFPVCSEQPVPREMSEKIIVVLLETFCWINVIVLLITGCQHNKEEENCVWERRLHKRVHFFYGCKDAGKPVTTASHKYVKNPGGNLDKIVSLFINRQNIILLWHGFKAGYGKSIKNEKTVNARIFDHE